MYSLVELNNAIYKLRKGKKVKIGIHLILTDPLKTYCEELNIITQNNSNNQIKLGLQTLNFPHITIYTGYISSSKSLEHIFNILSNYSKNIKKFTCKTSTLRFINNEQTTMKYLVILLDNINCLLKIKNDIANILNKYCNSLANKNNMTPNILIGIFKNIDNEFMIKLNNIKDIPNCSISHIGISFLGKHDTCLGYMKIFDLGSNQH